MWRYGGYRRLGQMCLRSILRAKEPKLENSIYSLDCTQGKEAFPEDKELLLFREGYWTWAEQTGTKHRYLRWVQGEDGMRALQ